MALSNLLGNELIKEWLRRAIKSSRLPSTLIFAGRPGVGKQTFARELAKMLNCLHPQPNGESCDQCRACRRIEANQFADLCTIKPDGQFIKVDQARAIIEELYFRPFEGRYRVYIIENAEQLREQAANALLKTLEEPPTTAIIILITANSDALLPTIRSRTIKLNFTPLSDADLENYLVAHYPRPTDQQQLLIRLASGSIGQALSIDLAQYRERCQECLSLLEHLGGHSSPAKLVKQAELLGRRERPEFEASRQILVSLLRDIICLQSGLPDQMINIDQQQALQALAARFSFERVSALLAGLYQIERDLIRNINRQMALEALLLSV